VKPGMDAPISAHLYERTIAIFEQLLQLLHPYMPFITEDIYHILRERADGDDLIVKQLPAYAAPEAHILKDGAMLQELITAVRDTRNKNNLKPKETISLWVDTQHRAFYEAMEGILRKQVNAEEMGFTTEAKAGCLSLVVQADKLYIGVQAAVGVDMTAQAEQMRKDLEYYQGFLASVEKKLNNERFMANAKPDVVAAERKKQEDALEKIKAIEEALTNLEV